VLANFIKCLIAVIVGNAVYFLLLTPLLPTAGRHSVGRLDLGLLIDFWVCLLAFGVIELIVKVRRGQR
jgi:hypothetical protein